MSDEEPVDQKKYFEDLCKPKCVRAWLDYQTALTDSKLPENPAGSAPQQLGRPVVTCQYWGWEGCVKRVEADDTGHKHCTGQYFDYWHCVDKCVAPKLFAKLK